MNNWFLYLIRCKHGRLYTGITTDVERRFEEHKSSDKKGSKYLRGKTPLKLVLKKKIGNKSMALKIEAKVKKLSKINKELLIEGKIKIRDLRPACPPGNAVRTGTYSGRLTI
jgi:putative endonuclease